MTRIDVQWIAGEAFVRYILTPDVAEQLAIILDEEANRSNDAGWREDSAKLMDAVNETIEP